MVSNSNHYAGLQWKSPSGVKKKVQNVQFGEKKDTNKLNVSMNAYFGGSL